MSESAALFQKGNRLAAAGRAAEAALAFESAARAAPGLAEIRFNLGNALAAAGQAVAAAEAYLEAVRLAPRLGAAWLNLAETLRGLGALEDAAAMAAEAARRLPGDHRARLALANIRHDAGDFAGAAADYQALLARRPRDAGLWSNLGNALHALGDYEAALAAHDRALVLRPGEAEAHFSRAFTKLALGEFVQGWAEYEWRWRRPGKADRGFGPAWRGEPIAGRTILLHAEQGQGDTIQFLRYVPLVRARGARVVLEVQPSLVRLAQGLGVEVVAADAVLPAFDAHCPLLSLPLAFGTRLETIPAATPYLAAEPGDWPARLPPGRRIGLCWAGAGTEAGRPYLIDRRRSLDPALLAPLAAVQGAAFISLQRDPPARPPLALFDVMAEMQDFADTARLVAALDLVIAVDTAVAHLAGALGKPVWLLSRFDGCWRWLQWRENSPWYPSMRIFRQESPGDWSGVVARVAAALGG